MELVRIDVDGVASVWTAGTRVCPACDEPIVCLFRSLEVHGYSPQLEWSRQVHPIGSARPIDPSVPSPYREDFNEAVLVLNDSPKASAALGRRCLQALLRNEGKTKEKDLAKQIDEVIAANSLPSHIVEALHAVRNIGNFAAHSMKSTSTGEILDVEPGEAEWTLDVLESLFDFYFVAPAKAQQRKDSLNEKLAEAGKPLLS